MENISGKNPDPRFSSGNFAIGYKSELRRRGVRLFRYTFILMVIITIAISSGVVPNICIMVGLSEP